MGRLQCVFCFDKEWTVQGWVGYSVFVALIKDGLYRDGSVTVCLLL